MHIHSTGSGYFRVLGPVLACVHSKCAYFSYTEKYLFSTSLVPLLRKRGTLVFAGRVLCSMCKVPEYLILAIYVRDRATHVRAVIL